MAKAGLASLIDGLFEISKVGVAGVAQHRAAQANASATRRRKKQGGDCTPCAAKAKGAALANGIWK